MRKARTCLVITAVVAVSLSIAGRAAAQSDDGPGRLHRIDIKAQHPKAYHPSIGDLAQCYMDFPIVPEQIVDDLKVAIDGKSVSLVAVVSTSRPKIVGSGQVSVFLAPRQTGLASVTITAIIPGQSPKSFKMAFLVTESRRR